MSKDPIVSTQATYIVIFRSKRTEIDEDGYQQTMQRMIELVQEAPGFINMQHYRDPEGDGGTLCYWKDLASINLWRENLEHSLAIEEGRKHWYQNYRIEIARLEIVRDFQRADA